MFFVPAEWKMDGKNAASFCPHSKEEPKLFCALAPEETVVPGFYKSQLFKVITVIVKDRERVKGRSELSLE